MDIPASVLRCTAEGARRSRELSCASLIVPQPLHLFHFISFPMFRFLVFVERWGGDCGGKKQKEERNARIHLTLSSVIRVFGRSNGYPNV
jgi:hypothetical protein